uniref:Coat protein n=1 Tax=Antarctic circular DNA molecule TaxID=2664238 RepID=A0A5Q2F2C6_9ZZZZ|nr:hypothetical protein [Antarctic circular DNA molecule]
MPFRKTYSKSKRPRSRAATPWYAKKYNAQQLAMKAWNATKYLKGLVNSELYHYDSTVSATISSTGFLTNLTAIAIGDSSATRTGNSILAKSINYRFKLEINSVVSGSTSVVVMLVQDTQQVADTNPIIADILQTVNPQSLLNLNTAGRFKVISRKNYFLSPSSGGKGAYEVSGFHKMYSHIRYNGATTSDTQKNGIYLLAISSEAVNVPTITGTYRLAYHDN